MQLFSAVLNDFLIVSADITALQNIDLSNHISKQRKKLFEFIKKRVPDKEDAEDILQEVFFQFTEAVRAMKPIEQTAAWLFRVAKNKIVDLYRRKRPDDHLNLSELIQDVDGDPENQYLRDFTWSEIEKALEELPKEQSTVFIMHEIEGMSFKDIAKITGESVNTLLSRKRYAVVFLRKRLKHLYKETIGVNPSHA